MLSVNGCCSIKRNLTGLLEGGIYILFDVEGVEEALKGGHASIFIGI